MLLALLMGDGIGCHIAPERIAICIMFLCEDLPLPLLVDSEARNWSNS